MKAVSQKGVLVHNFLKSHWSVTYYAEYQKWKHKSVFFIIYKKNWNIYSYQVSEHQSYDSLDLMSETLKTPYQQSPAGQFKFTPNVFCLNAVVTGDKVACSHWNHSFLHWTTSNLLNQVQLETADLIKLHVSNRGISQTRTLKHLI